MFFPHTDGSIRFSGRWATLENARTATATGSSFTFAFRGSHVRMDFDLTWNVQPVPHLWISVDGGAAVEAPLDWRLRVNASGDGDHTVTVILKSAVEMQHRWHKPLVARVAFLGYEADGAGILAPDPRKTIEFVGDSISEGVLIDVPAEFIKPSVYNRPLQDDVCATYAWLTAKALNLRSLHFGYGAVGITRGGCGGTPRAIEGYPYCFEGAPTDGEHPDFVLINHGANDRGEGKKEAYLSGYCELMDLIRATHPNAKIIALSAFCGAYCDELGETVAEYNLRTGADVLFIPTAGWISPEPLHPLRDGHRTVAEKLTKILKETYGL